jgi:hypothetical protein
MTAPCKKGGGVIPSQSLSSIVRYRKLMFNLFFNVNNISERNTNTKYRIIKLLIYIVIGFGIAFIWHQNGRRISYQ